MAKKKEEAAFGQASSDRSEHGKLVVVDQDTEEGGKVYKAGAHDLPIEEAGALIAAEKGHEPDGKGKGVEALPDA